MDKTASAHDSSENLTVETVGPTGVEMEALTAVQVAMLTIYDMCNGVVFMPEVTSRYVPSPNC